MYHKERLKAAMTYKGKDIEDLAQVLECSTGTAYRKLNEGKFSLDEVGALMKAGFFDKEECSDIFFDLDRCENAI